MGLSVFPYIIDIISGRKQIVDYYNSRLSFSNYKTMKLRNATDWNYSYYPIIFENENALLKVQIELNNNQIYPRRYFYPSLNKLKYVTSLEMPISESIASRILCLPLSNQIDEIVLKNICEIVDNNISK